MSSKNKHGIDEYAIRELAGKIGTGKAFEYGKLFYKDKDGNATTEEATCQIRGGKEKIGWWVSLNGKSVGLCFGHGEDMPANNKPLSMGQLQKLFKGEVV
jgi:hypothetical protein